jgi:hypothetical protein
VISKGTSGMGSRVGAATTQGGALRVAPVEGETAWSYLGRAAARYGMEPSALLGQWAWVNQRPQADGGGVRPDAEILFNPAGQQLLAQVGGAGPVSLARALPSWTGGPSDFGERAGDRQPLARWRVASAVGVRVAFGCRLCTARRTGQADAVVRYAPRWARLCGRHQRWGLDADAGCGLEHLDLRGVPEVVAARRRWDGVARRAFRARAEPQRVWGVAYAVVCRWWDQALAWERERVWPARLHTVAS